jgi:two-component system response regulator YesN
MPASLGKTPPTTRLLVVDNETVIRRLLTMYLEHSGFACDGAASGEEALAMLSQTPGRFHAVITDLEMPEMDGLQLAGFLRERFPTVKVLIVSGTDSPPSARILKEMGNTAFLHKPVTRVKLVDSLQSLLGVQA